MITLLILSIGVFIILVQKGLSNVNASYNVAVLVWVLINLSPVIVIGVVILKKKWGEIALLPAIFVASYVFFFGSMMFIGNTDYSSTFDSIGIYFFHLIILVVQTILIIAIALLQKFLPKQRLYAIITNLLTLLFITIIAYLVLIPNYNQNFQITGDYIDPVTSKNRFILADSREAENTLRNGTILSEQKIINNSRITQYKIIPVFNSCVYSNYIGQPTSSYVFNIDDGKTDKWYRFNSSYNRIDIAEKDISGADTYQYVIQQDPGVRISRGYYIVRVPAKTTLTLKTGVAGNLSGDKLSLFQSKFGEWNTNGIDCNTIDPIKTININ